MSRGQKLEPVVPPIKLVGKRLASTGPFAKGEWRQDVEVGGRAYRVAMRRGERVRIAFKPAGQNWGHRWVASVWRTDPREGERAHVWDGEVAGSLGVRGILLEARVVTTESRWWRDWYRCWFWFGAAIHARQHPKCADPEDRRFGRRTSRFDLVHVCQETCTHWNTLPGIACPWCGVRVPRPRKENP